MDSLLPGRSTLLSIQPRSHPAARPSLIVISGPGMGQHIQLQDENVDIGRSTECAFCIDSEKISRRHANVVRAAGQFVVMDLNSTNGTFLNEQRVQMAELTDGDRIRIGNSVLKYTESPVELEYFEQVLNRITQDALTGVYTKQSFDEQLAIEVKRATPAAPLSLLLFDIDFFKKINDGFGHAAGDEVLKGVASLAQATVPTTGKVGRVGGEEFAVLLPGVSLEAAQELAERLRARVSEERFEVEGHTISVTISLGTAELAPNEDVKALFGRTDELLYRSKREGRNRVSF